ncbi:hypothetical protein JXA88_18090 [Candidatus Fermentibacteria bacterium]|nr:hypothetical protein [Candidatus Fermentibacteria bacterium]
MREVITGVLVAFLAGCGNEPAPDAAKEIAVVWVVGAVPPEGIRLETADAVARELAGVTLSLYGVSTQDDARRLLRTLKARGDSIVVGLGRPMLQALRTTSEGSHGGIWLGFDDPGPGYADGLVAWWAPAESLRIELARRATQAGTSMMVVGSATAGVLRVVRDSGAQARFATPIGSRHTGLLPSPGEVVLMLDEMPMPRGTNDVYWACESPFATPREARVFLRMDWAGALTAAIRWRFGHGGASPGPTLGPWLTIHEERGEGS